MDNITQEPGMGNPDNSTMPEISQDEVSSQSLWGELSEDDKATIGNKGFKTPADLLKSYRELEKSSSTKFSIPKDDDKDAWDKLYQRLGKPDDIKGYTLKMLQADIPYEEDFKNTCLNYGLNDKQATGIYNWYKDNQNKVTEQFNEKSLKEQSEIRELWGSDYDKNLECMKRGFKITGLDTGLLENIEIALGSKEFMLLGYKLGEIVSEDTAKGLGSKPSKPLAMSTEEYFNELFNQQNK